MPTVLRDGPYRFYFYKGEVGSEPSHVHVRRERHVAKFWLEPPRLASGGGFTPIELRRIWRIVCANQRRLLEAWYGVQRP